VRRDLGAMPHIPGLRSVYAKVGRLVHFGRMLDKIRLHAVGRLPADYVTNLGDGELFLLDSRCCRFLGVAYADIKARTLQGGTDEEILAWVEARGTKRTDEECHIWNRFILKLGWRDERSHVLPERIRSGGHIGKPIETIIDCIEYDEGRDPVAERAWEKV
jgi:gluconokinase